MVNVVIETLLHDEDDIMQQFPKIYTARASLCLLGCYFRQERVFDDFKTLPILQKKSSMLPGRNSLMPLCLFWQEARP